MSGCGALGDTLNENLLSDPISRTSATSHEPFEWIFAVECGEVECTVVGCGDGSIGSHWRQILLGIYGSFVFAVVGDVAVEGAEEGFVDVGEADFIAGDADVVGC